MTNANKLILQLRFFQFGFIMSVPLYVYVLLFVCPVQQSLNVYIQFAIVCCAITSAIGGFIMQRMIMNTPDRPNALGQMPTPRGRWFSGHLFQLASAEFVALFGFVLRMLGGYSNVVIALFAGSLLLLVFWQPGEVPTENESQSSIG
jgi:hypothetical protein